MMKRIAISALFLLFIFPVIPSAQPWMNGFKGKKENFYDLQKTFNEYWKGRPILKGKGYKPFKRWEYFMEPRVYPSGNFPDPAILYNEWVKLKSQNGSGKLSKKAGTWTSMGPVQVPSGGGAGRVNCIRFDPNNTSVIWAGSPSGGLWKSTDGGTTWSSNTGVLPNLGVTDVAIDPTNPAIMYIATGDGDASDTYSAGILKSTDSGATWNTTGLTFTISLKRTIHRLLIHPTSTNILFAATSNGIYKSSNNGTNWSIVKTGEHWDMEFNPSDPAVVYATTSNRIVKSTDTGVTWTNLSTGLPPTTSIRRVCIAVTPANANVIYALFVKTADDGFYGLYKSSDSGVNFTQQSTTPNILGSSSDGSDAGGQGWYDLALAASPANENILFAGGINIWKSTNGGTSWTISAHWYGGGGAPYAHADIHDLIFQPGSGSVIYSGNDGGVFKSTSTGSSWSDKSDGLSIHQIYRFGVSKTSPDKIIVGAQDNGTSLLSTGIWNSVYGGDGMECLIDFTNANIMYCSVYNGYFYRSSNGGGNFSDVSPSVGGSGAWVTPFVIHPTNNQTLYAGYTDVFKSTNSGSSWTQISTNLSGSYLQSLAVAPSDANTIYAASYYNIYKTVNGGTAWTTITGTLPAAGLALTYITVHPTDPQTVFVTFSGYTASNKIYKTNNGGTSWTNITSTGLPNVPANCSVFEDNGNDALYIGTDLGIFYTNNTMSTWISFNDGLPNVIINELEIHPTNGKIRAATYGRGVWESPLFVPATVSLDAGIISVLWPAQIICDSSSITPVVRLKNMGVNTLTSVTINYVIDTANYSYNWTGNLATGSQVDVSLPSLILSGGSHTIEASTSGPNGSTDGNTLNDMSSGTFITGTTPPSTIALFPYFTDFESCDAWTHSVTAISNGNINPSPADNWEQGVPSGSVLKTTHSGTKVYGTNLTGDYDYSSYSKLMSPTFNLTNMIAPTVQFWMAFDIELDWDALYFEYTINGGSTWTKLGTAADPNWYNSSATGGGNPPGALMTGAQWTGTDAIWKLYSHSLSALAGQAAVKFRFNLASDEYAEQEGIVMDDFKVYDQAVTVTEIFPDGFRVYPNPTTGNLLIDVGGGITASFKVTIFNPVGQRVFSSVYKPSSTYIPIPVPGEAEGIFVIEIECKGQVVRKKVTVFRQ